MYSRFTTEIAVRPDDIDVNNHVHSGKYIDYVLAARYIQMRECYGFPMEEFIKEGYAWVIAETHMVFKRPLVMQDTACVTTAMKELHDSNCVVEFEITRKLTGKLCCDGWFKYTMININTGRSTPVPEHIKEKYRI